MRAIVICNRRSGSYSEALESEIDDALTRAGHDIARHIVLPDMDLPSRDALEAEGVGLVAIFSGDGTITALTEKLTGWDGEILVLPGGTMNLLAKRLHHGDDVRAILATVARGGLTGRHVPVIETDAGISHVSIIAGPATIWGEVREAIRDHDVVEIAQLLPEALSTAGPEGDGSVTISGEGGTGYPALFIEPRGFDALAVHAVSLDGVDDMFKHAMAWLSHDFRDGPMRLLGLRREVEIAQADGAIGLLLDGERCRHSSPLRCRAGRSGLRFLAAAG